MPAVLVVGAGFAGAVYARTLAEAGFAVHIIDRRDHIGGNAADFVDANGVRVHRYGPHLFHTNATHVFDWLQRFGAFVPYHHRVRAKLPDGRLVPLPVNLDTINAVFDARLQTEADAAAFLQARSVPIADPRNAAEHLRSRIGDVLTDLFFRPYTRKMWDWNWKSWMPAWCSGCRSASTAATCISPTTATRRCRVTAIRRCSRHCCGIRHQRRTGRRVCRRHGT